MDLFYFEFSSCKQKSDEQFNYRVFAESMNDMNMFLIQHNLHDQVQNVEVVDPAHPTNLDTVSYNMIKPFVFGSNKSKEIFTIYTSEEFVSDAVGRVGSKLSASLLFGEAITRTDVELFDRLTNLINDLPYCDIIDFELMNQESNLIMEFKEKRNEYFYYTGIAPAEDGAEALIYQGLYDSMQAAMDDTCYLTDSIQPITVEAYVKAFTDRMIDSY